MKDIKNVKKRVDELEEILDLQEGGQPLEGIKMGIFGKPRKSNDLVPLETTIRNLTSLI